MKTLSLLLTLIATPVGYSWLDDLAHARAVRFAKTIALWPLRKVDRLVTRKPLHRTDEPAAAEE